MTVKNSVSCIMEMKDLIRDVGTTVISRVFQDIYL